MNWSHSTVMRWKWRRIFLTQSERVGRSHPDTRLLRWRYPDAQKALQELAERFSPTHQLLVGTQSFGAPRSPMPLDRNGSIWKRVTVRSLSKFLR